MDSSFSEVTASASNLAVAAVADGVLTSFCKGLTAQPCGKFSSLADLGIREEAAEAAEGLEGIFEVILELFKA